MVLGVVGVALCSESVLRDDGVRCCGGWQQAWFSYTCQAEPAVIHTLSLNHNKLSFYNFFFSVPTPR